MSENTNKLFWIISLGIIAAAVVIMFFNSVTKPNKNMYDSINNMSLCGSSSRKDSLICLDASENSELQGHQTNASTTRQNWYAQGNLEEKDTGKATLNNFDYNENSGWLPYALKLDGVNDTISLGQASKSFVNGFTGQINVKFNAIGRTSTLMSNGNVVLSTTTANKITFSVKTSSGTYTVTSKTTISANKWYLIQATYNNDRIKLYIDGELDNYQEISGSITTTATQFTSGSNLKGEISSIIIYNRDIEEEGIAQNTVAINNKTYDITEYQIGFVATDSCELWTAPMDGQYHVELWGAQGGSVNGGTGGRGAYVTGTIDLTAGTNLYVCVGKQGTTATNLANGGNATDIRTTYTGSVTAFNSLKSRIAIAAGGGGGNKVPGGDGGAVIGLSSKGEILNMKNAKGGTQAAGGAKAINISTAYDSATLAHIGVDGEFGIRGTVPTGASGGNGYFSGGSIKVEGGGAGGSSYISGNSGVNSITSASTASNIEVTLDNIHFSGYKFYSTQMLTGASIIPSSSDLDGHTTGQLGDGYARITYVAGFE